jgi:hypothetical protein
MKIRVSVIPIGNEATLRLYEENLIGVEEAIEACNGIKISGPSHVWLDSLRSAKQSFYLGG